MRHIEHRNLLTTDELVSAIKISRETIRKYIKGGLPFIPLGPKRKGFIYEEVITWLKQNKGD